jgi:hypothetical protein
MLHLQLISSPIPANYLISSLKEKVTHSLQQNGTLPEVFDELQPQTQCMQASRPGKHYGDVQLSRRLDLSAS